MNKEQLAQRLMAAFLEELHDHVGAMNRHLLALEKNPAAEQRQALLKELFRSAHTLKGAANANSQRLMEQFCHRLEDILVAIRDGRRAFTDDLFVLFFQAADALEEAGSRLEEEVDLNESPLSRLFPQVERAAAGESFPIPPPKSTGEVIDPDEPPCQPPCQPPLPPLPHLAELEQSGNDDLRGVTPSPDPFSTPASAPVSAPCPSQFRIPAHASDSPPERTNASVRVAAEKLDTLLAQTGELLVARRRVESRLAELRELRDWTFEWSTAWRLVEKPIRQLVEPSLMTQRTGVATKPALPRRVAAMLQQTGERIRQFERRLEHLTKVLRDDSRLLAQTCDALDDQVNRVRMLPFSEVCASLDRAVRDVAHVTGKQVELLVDGADVEVDRSVLEELKGPLLHLVRNAVDHGIELLEDRLSAGKPPVAQVTVSVTIRGTMIEVVIGDDGRGFDLQRIREIAGQRGLVIPHEERDLVRLIFEAGFSTARQVTDISGRGIGLDVVQSKIEALHGTVAVDFIRGKGSRFILQVPLTLTTIRAVLVRVGEHTYVVPTSSVRRILRFDTTRIASVGGRCCLLGDETPIPIRFLAEFVSRAATAQFSAGKQLGLELSSANSQALFVVDEIIAEQEVVVKSLGHRIRRVRHVSGATMLPSGRVALLLNIPSLIRSALGQSSNLLVMPKSDQIAVPVRRLLVAEDSLTTRTLMKSILETAGYEVLTAADGQQARELMDQEKFDLVVSDVDMPRMTGFELAESIRGAKHFASLPIILVTARYSDGDKARGAEVGANAYVIKSAFDQRILLETISQLL